MAVELENFKTGERYVIDEPWLELLKQLAVERVTVPALSIVSVDDEVLTFNAQTIQRLEGESAVFLTRGGHRLEVLSPDVMLAIQEFLDTPGARSTVQHLPK